MEKILYYYGFDENIATRHTKKIADILGCEILCIKLDSFDELPPNACLVINDEVELDMLENICKKATVIVISNKITRYEGIKLGVYDVFKPDSLDALCFAINNMLERQHHLNEIYKYKSRLNFYSEVSNSIMYIKSPKGVYEAVNDNFLEITGLSREEIIGKDFVDLWLNTPEICGKTAAKVLETKHMVEFDAAVSTFEGIRQYHAKKGVVMDIEGKPEAVLTYAVDITDKIKEEAKLKLLLENMPFAVGICDENGIYRNCNSYMKRIFGDIVGQKKGHLTANYTVNYENGRNEVLLFKGEELLIFEYKAIPFTENDTVLGELAILIDISEQKKQEEKTRKEAMTDVLTGLPNRRCLVEFYKALKPDVTVSFLFMDIDDFKSKNDKYGHAVGDEFLKATAQILKEVFNGDFVARLGGDEFVVCINHRIAKSQLENKIRELREKGKWAYIEKQKLLENINFSIGVIHNAISGLTLDEVMDLCDDAMYKAKRKGKDTYVFTEEEKYYAEEGK